MYSNLLQLAPGARDFSQAVKRVPVRVRSQTTLTRYFLPPFDIFYGMNVEKKWTFLDHLTTSP